MTSTPPPASEIARKIAIDHHQLREDMEAASDGRAPRAVGADILDFKDTAALVGSIEAALESARREERERLVAIYKRMYGVTTDQNVVKELSKAAPHAGEVGHK